MNDENNPKFLIIAGGKPVEANLLKNLTRLADRIICADAGAEAARRNDIIPNSIIGDFDSVSEGTLAFFKRIELMEVVEAYEQDKTDLEKAIILALSQGAKEIMITCAAGKRNDHLLHTLGLLAKYHEKASLTLIDEQDLVALKKKSFRVDSIPGETISLIPWGGPVKKVTTTGLKYPLFEEDLITGERESISNAAESDSFSVDFQSGMLLLVRHHRIEEFRDSHQIKFDF